MLSAAQIKVIPKLAKLGGFALRAARILIVLQKTDVFYRQ
jgi:hypothetical protein